MSGLRRVPSHLATTKSRVHHLDVYDPNIAVSGYKLKRIKSCKLLGVHINEHLKWDDHIKHTGYGCYATLSILRKLKYLAKYELRKQLAGTLILSKLDYADLVFYPLPKFLLRCLQRVQFAAASFVLGHCVKNFLFSPIFLKKLTITEPFSPIYLKETTNYYSVSVSRTVSQLINMRVRKPKVEYKLVQLCRKNPKTQLDVVV